MRFTGKVFTVELGEHCVHLRRTTGGVMEVWADDEVQLSAGIGFAHACDRLVQMVVYRLVGQGGVSEHLRAGDNELRMDMFARLMGFRRLAEREWNRCSPEMRGWIEAYCQGVNHYLQRYSLPLEFRLLGHRVPLWKPADTLLVAKLITYFMGHSQRQMEKFLVQAVRSGVDVDHLKYLFAPHLDGLDDRLVSQIRRVNVWEPPVPAAGFLNAIPHLSASNNWAVAPFRTVSGSALECHDPHLPCSQLPQTWYELVTHVGERYGIGVGIPGLPGLLMGRNNDVSLGFTYGYMDMIDFFMEECRDGRYRHDGEMLDFDVRRERILRRGKPPVDVTIYENQRGVLDYDPYIAEVPEGLHLSCAWSGREQGAAELLDVTRQFLDFRSVTSTQDVLRHAAISANWVVADRGGNIGYQQSGLLPARCHSGLYPLPGWDPASAWQGLIDPRKLASELNPASGIVVTANDFHCGKDGPCAINLCMGSDRSDRARELLRETARLTVTDMKRMQRDLFSQHAARWMQRLRPLLPPELASSRLLREWNMTYDAASRGATLFEMVYDEILREVCGKRLFGEHAWTSLIRETPLLGNFFQYFDRAILGHPSRQTPDIGLGPAGCEDLLRQTLHRVLRQIPPERVVPWGQRQQVELRYVLSPRRIPWLDFGPVSLEGSRATLMQANLVRAYGRSIVVAPSYRYVTDLGVAAAETSIAGGPSGRPWSRHYRVGLQDWLRYEYKSLKAETGSLQSRSARFL
jgi:penicillin amidase